MRFISQIDETGCLQKGEYIKPPDYCIKNHCKNKCRSFYATIKDKEKEHFYTCPMGMSVYLTKDGEIFTCMRERESYDKIKAKPLSNHEGKSYNPVMDAEQLNSLIDYDELAKLSIPKHINLLIKNKTGLKNFYKMLSDANTTHTAAASSNSRSILSSVPSMQASNTATK